MRIAGVTAIDRIAMTAAGGYPFRHGEMGDGVDRWLQIGRAALRTGGQGDGGHLQRRPHRLEPPTARGAQTRRAFHERLGGGERGLEVGTGQQDEERVASSGECALRRDRVGDHRGGTLKQAVVSPESEVVIEHHERVEFGPEQRALATRLGPGLDPFEEAGPVPDQLRGAQPLHARSVRMRSVPFNPGTRSP